MRLHRAQVRDYRSVHDSEEFEVERAKTLLVGVNEAGKTAILRGLQMINPPEDAEPPEALRDYPRSRYTEIQSGHRDPSDVWIAKAAFTLDEADRAALRAAAPSMAGATEFILWRYLDNNLRFRIEGVQSEATYADISKDVARLRAHLAKQEDTEDVLASLDKITANISESTRLIGTTAKTLDEWLEEAYPHIDEDNEKEEQRFDRLRAAVLANRHYQAAYLALRKRVPLFVYYSTYFTVRPRIHLSSFAAREASGDLDTAYDFGNQCLLKLLGFTAQELADLATGAPPNTRPSNQTQEQYEAEVRAHQDRLDDRHYRLNAASVSLTRDIRQVWGDDEVTLRLVADGQYLKVMVVDDLGVEVELDQPARAFAGWSPSSSSSRPRPETNSATRSCSSTSPA